MNYAERIYKILIAAVIKGYCDGIKDVVKLTKKHVQKFDDEPSKIFDIRWNQTDERLLNIFKKECFTVALIGKYELEEKIKEIAVKVQQDMPEGGWKLNGKSISPQNLFAVMTRELIGEYTGGDAGQIPPAGWLRTNINTANSSAYHAAEYQRLQQVSDIYSYYKYMTRADDRVRDEHAALHGKVFFHSDPIWNDIWPPNGWNCRCYVTPLTADEAQSEGTYVPPVESEHQRELVKTVPPDFRRNPGIEEHIFTKWAQQKLKDMPASKRAEIENKVKDFDKTRDKGLLGEKSPKLNYEQYLNDTEKQYFENYEMNYSESILSKKGVTAGESSVYLRSKKIFIDIDERTLYKPNVFKHEVGHCIDIINGFSKQNDFVKLIKNKNEIFKILDTRMKIYLTREEYGVYSKQDIYSKKLFLKGSKLLYGNKFFNLKKHEREYLLSKREIFAEGYSQWLLNTDFKNYAKKFNKYFQDMAKKKIKEFSEEKEEIIRSYSYPVIEEMFKKKYGYKIIDGLPLDEQEKIDKQFRQFLEDLGYGPNDDSIFDF